MVCYWMDGWVEELGERHNLCVSSANADVSIVDPLIIFPHLYTCIWNLVMHNDDVRRYHVLWVTKWQNR